MSSIGAVLIGVVFAGCSSGEVGSDADLVELSVPALEDRDRTVVGALDELNQQLSAIYPNHPNLPIIIERGYSWNDMGDEALIVPSLPEQSLAERLRVFGAGTIHGHWTTSHNGFIIFKTWHNGVPDEAPDFGFD